MKAKYVIIAAALLSATFWAAPAGAQQEDLRAITPITTASRSAVDPFADLNRAAKDKHFTWIEFNDSLPTDVAGCAPCSGEAQEMIRQARDLCKDAHTTRGDYLKSWRNLAQQDTSRFARMLSDRMPLRREIELSLASAEQQIAELQTRAEQLRQSAEEKGVSAGNAEASLGTLLQNAEDRADTLREAIERWDEAQKYAMGSKEHAQAVQETVRQMQDLIAAESTLWQAYYDGMELRAEFNCWKVRNGQGPEPRALYRPAGNRSRD